MRSRCWSVLGQRKRRPTCLTWAFSSTILRQGCGTERPAARQRRHPFGQSGGKRPSPPAYIRPGDVGTGVRCIQQALNYWDHAGLPVDGVNGYTTTDAIERFQREQNLSVDGVVGPDTAGPLYAIDNTYLHLGTVCRSALPTPAAPQPPNRNPTVSASP